MVVIAVHATATHVAGAVICTSGRLSERHREVLAKRQAQDASASFTMSALLETIGALTNSSPAARVAIALSPAVVDAVDKRSVEDAVHLPIRFEKEAAAAAWGELLMAGEPGQRRADDSMTVTVGASIHAALIVGGRLARGRNGLAGEIGHMPFMPQGRPCVCGSTGCLDAYASTSALVEQVKRSQGGAPAARPQSPLDLARDLEAESRGIVQAAEAGGVAAQVGVADMGRYLGMAVGRLIQPLGITDVVLRGAVAERAGDLLLAPFRHALREVVSQQLDVDCRLGKPGDDVVLLGVADLTRTGRDGVRSGDRVQ